MLGGREMLRPSARHTCITWCEQKPPWLEDTEQVTNVIPTVSSQVFNTGVGCWEYLFILSI